MTNRRQFCLSALAVLFCPFAPAHSADVPVTGPKNGTVLLIRHAEKPETGDGLTPAGEARAKAYVEYFTNFKLNSDPLKPDEIFVAADSKNSRRPRLTVEPLAQALKLEVNATYKDKDFLSLVNALRVGHDGKTLLVCWHHGPMGELLQAFGANLATVLPGGRWPQDEYRWVVVLRYDQEGHLKEAQRVVEGF